MKGNKHMKPKYIFISILAVLFVFPLIGTFAQQAPDSIRITVLTTFDYPGTDVISTQPQKINDAGDIAGNYVDSSFVVRGFIRFRDGTFSAPIVEPNDTENFTAARGINNSRLICGSYVGSDGTLHGFFLSFSTFREYDVPNSVDTEVLGINNHGDFAGGFTPTSTGIPQAFVNIDGTVHPIQIPGSTFTAAYQLNASDAFEGYYGDGLGFIHGFYQDSSRTLHFPIDAPGSTAGTILFGINDQNWMVGRVDLDILEENAHAILFIAPNKFVFFDYPGSTFTSFNGINRTGLICGRYKDSSGIEHGIIAQVRNGPEGK
ncbi:MAG: hypothetical protein DME96_03240 [Verrucomicrobia bacterium]|nr:MAG: hypothetical protein DME96_03240 [Verrucomicrobiota bacterium]